MCPAKQGEDEMRNQPDPDMPFMIDNNYEDMAVMAKAAADWLGLKAKECGARDLEELAHFIGEDFGQLCRVRKLIQDYAQAGQATAAKKARR